MKSTCPECGATTVVGKGKIWFCSKCEATNDPDGGYMTETTEGELLTIKLRGHEEWREYDFGGRVYRIEGAVSVTFRRGGSTHRVLGKDGTVHCMPAPGFNGCVLRWRGDIVV